MVPEIFSSWGFWFAIGAAVVVIAAAVVITILVVARGIEKEAARALAAGARVKENTDAIFALGGALDGLEAIRVAAGEVEKKAAHLARAVHGESAGAAGMRGPEGGGA